MVATSPPPVGLEAIIQLAKASAYVTAHKTNVITRTIVGILRAYNFRAFCLINNNVIKVLRYKSSVSKRMIAMII